MTATSFTRRRNYRLGALGVALVVIAAGAADWQVSTQKGSPSAPTKTVPSWFRPIANYYGNDSRITPQFDFAAQYGGRRSSSRH